MSFVGFAAFEAPSPDKATVVTRKGFAGADRELERACKQCGKKDASTKLKGLEALVARVSDVDANEVRAVAHWLKDARVVELLGFKDDDARVRDEKLRVEFSASQKANAEFAALVDRRDAAAAIKKRKRARDGAND